MGKPSARHFLRVEHDADTDRCYVIGMPYDQLDNPVAPEFRILIPAWSSEIARSTYARETAINSSDLTKLCAAFGMTDMRSTTEQTKLDFVRQSIRSGKRFDVLNRKSKGNFSTYTPKPVENPTPPVTVTGPNLDVNEVIEIAKTAAEVAVNTRTEGLAELLSDKTDQAYSEVMEKAADAIRTAVENAQPPVIVIESHNIAKQLTYKVHNIFPKVLRRIAIRQNVMLIGPAGSGKSTLGQQVAETLDLPFYPMTCSAQMSVAEVKGYMDAHGKFVETSAYRAFKFGGVYMADEFDACSPNAALAYNMMTANGVYAFANGEAVTKHPDFVFIAGMNTYGTGATAEYVGRNVIDAATRNRFSKITMGYDEELEEHLTVSVNPSRGMEWLNIVRACRANAAKDGIKVVISPRDAIDGAKILNDSDETFSDVAEERFLAGLAHDQRAKVVYGVKGLS